MLHLTHFMHERIPQYNHVIPLPNFFQTQIYVALILNSSGMVSTGNVWSIFKFYCHSVNGSLLYSRAKDFASEILRLLSEIYGNNGFHETEQCPRVLGGQRDKLQVTMPRGNNRGVERLWTFNGQTSILEEREYASEHWANNIFT